jgi:hypothetical protein
VETHESTASPSAPIVATGEEPAPATDRSAGIETRASTTRAGAKGRRAEPEAVAETPPPGANLKLIVAVVLALALAALVAKFRG